MISSTQFDTKPTSTNFKEFGIIVNSIAGEPVLTKHPIVDNVIGDGHFIDAESMLDELSSTIYGDTNQFQIIDTRVLVHSSKCSIFYTKSALKDVWINKSLFKVKVPALIWKVEQRSITVFALATSARPNANTNLYHVPFSNISHTGSLCQGSSTFPKQFTSTNIDDYEFAFWESKFSHRHDNTLKKPMNHSQFLNWLAKKEESQEKIYGREMKPAGKLSSLMGVK